MSELTSILSWTLEKKCPVPEDVQSILARGEDAVAAYKTFRDAAIFTTKRLIIRDAQGLTGKKVQIYSLPYSSILMWSSENTKKINDYSAELNLWTRLGFIRVKLSQYIDIRELDALLAQYIL